MKSELKVFVAGSKELEEERKICRSVCNILQNQWGTIITKTFEDFSEAISKVGHQKEYNIFIEELADVVIFVFSKKVGEITRLEFEHAYNSFMKNGHPQILIYIDKSGDAKSEDIEKLKTFLSEKDQYYKEYISHNELEQMLEKHLTKILTTHTKPLPVALWVIVAWCILMLLGGIGMYIYDQNMSHEECINIAAKYVENGRDREYIYYSDNETFVYNDLTNSLEILNRNHSTSSAEVSLSKAEHVAFGATASVLLTRLFKTKVKGNGKTIIAYTAGAVAVAVGCGIGCVIEQMIFPPQYSQPVKDCLSNKSNWTEIINKKSPNHWF